MPLEKPNIGRNDVIPSPIWAKYYIPMELNRGFGTIFINILPLRGIA
jgi:hypothetical protein